MGPLFTLSQEFGTRASRVTNRRTHIIKHWTWFDQQTTRMLLATGLAPEHPKATLFVGGLKYSPRLSKFRREHSARTLSDILLADRFDQLDDTEANCRLSVGYEVPMTANISEDCGGGKISGRADWSLGYMTELDKLEQMLVVIEAKTDVSSNRNMAQLVAYLHAIQEARVQSKKNSSAVFGVLTDSKLFRFVVLRD
ncbi:hypothetical protein I7I51_02599 [Histoplasma capsulatum]|uniref:Uncharacterized protein n=1 Tax=Ajellomyces capsulatus TaxID=5037 RepID=A0A8A1M8M7_AJECA|nr:hypothetical protein I7I51_02599 [Histoplasma capsulatum]